MNHEQELRKGENMNKKVTGFSFLSLSLCAFGGLGMEVLYALIEPSLYKANMNAWSDAQTILHWVITCITWGLFAWYLFRESKKCGLSLFQKSQKMKTWQWTVLAIVFLFNFYLSYISWGGFKVILEFQRKGALRFTFQYIYYAVEVVLVMLIIIFAQKAFELWFHNTNIPYGGMICGITWGLVHALTKGSLLIGLQGILIGFLFGASYLLVNKDIKKCYIALFFMFVL